MDIADLLPKSTEIDVECGFKLRFQDSAKSNIIIVTLIDDQNAEIPFGGITTNSDLTRQEVIDNAKRYIHEKKRDQLYQQ